MLEIDRFVIAALATISLPALAASPPPPTLAPGAAQQRTQHTEQYYEQRQQHPQPKAPANPVIGPAQSNGKGTGGSESGPGFVLRAVTFSPSHFLSNATLQAIAKPYVGHTVHVADLRKIVAQINKTYTQREIYTARAILPPQRIENGVVHIELVEGKLESLQIEHNAYTHKDFIRSRVSQQTGKVVDGAQLRRDLVFFNRTSDIQLRAVLRPGSEKGLTRILLLAQEPDRFRFDPFVDNNGADSTGRNRGGFALQYFDPLGIDDRFDAYFVGNSGALAGFASYSLPVNRLNGRVGLSYSRNQINIIHGPFQQLDISGHASTISLNFTQPFIANTHWLASWASSVSYTDSKTNAADVNIATSKTGQLATGFTVTHNAGLHQWSVTNTFHYAHSQETLDDKHGFFVYDGLGSYVQVFGKSPWSMLLTLGGQWAPADQLPSQTLFQIGGVDTVRGYEQGVVAGTSGFYGQLELHRRLRSWLDGFAFADGGGVYQAFPTTQYLASTGLGLSFRYKTWVTAKFDVGFPLETVTPNQDDYRVNFRVALHWAP